MCRGDGPRRTKAAAERVPTTVPQPFDKVLDTFRDVY